jgi:RimJ/RimL family protein N-acetyltransferase
MKTERLTIRPLTLDDAPAVQTLAGAYEVALNTLLVPHPYPDGAAEQWISMDDPHRFAIDDGQLVGAIGLMMKGDGIAEIGYWIGVPFWGRGYASEAAREVIRYGFEECGLHRIYAGIFRRNPASGRVLEKAGLTYEGTLRKHQKKWDEYLDVLFYGILREEWLASRNA